MNLRTSHRFPVSLRTFWDRVFFDREYNQTLYRQHLNVRQYEILAFEDDGDGIRRKVKVIPQQNAPVVIQKLLQGEFSYVEEGVFDKKSGVYKFRIIPSIKADKIKISGTVTAEPQGEDTVQRTIDLELKADIFAIGGQIEKFVGEQIQKGYEASYQFTLDWIGKKNLR